MSESPQEWILKRRHEDLGVTVRMCWDLYIKFYTVFLTFSVIGLGWITDAPCRPSNDSPRKTGYCHCISDPNDPHRDNKCRNRALYSACGERPRPHRGSPYSIAPWRKTFGKAGCAIVVGSVGRLVQLCGDASHGRLVDLCGVHSLATRYVRR